MNEILITLVLLNFVFTLFLFYRKPSNETAPKPEPKVYLPTVKMELNDILITKINKYSYMIRVCKEEGVGIYGCRTPNGTGAIVEAFYNGQEIQSNMKYPKDALHVANKPEQGSHV